MFFAHMRVCWVTLKEELHSPELKNSVKDVGDQMPPLSPTFF